MQEVIVKYNGDIFEAINFSGVYIDPLLNGYAIITLDEGKLPLLYDIPNIEYIELPDSLELLGERENSSVCIFKEDGCQYSFIARECLNGDGVIAAVIDSGINYKEQAFINDDGTSKIIFAYDLSRSNGVLKGIEYTNDDINNALENNIELDFTDNIGHGTAIAKIITDIAPSAKIIAVKLSERSGIYFARNTDIMRALKYVLYKAQELFMPVCINLSYGTNFGAHNGNSLFENYMDSAALVWKNVICVPTGNEGASGKHFAGRLSTGNAQTSEIVIGEATESIYIFIYKNIADVAEIEITSPNGEKSGRIAQNFPIYSYYANNTRISAEFVQPTPYSAESYFLVRLSGGVAKGIWKITL